MSKEKHNPSFEGLSPTKSLWEYLVFLAQAHHLEKEFRKFRSSQELPPPKQTPLQRLREIYGQKISR